MKRKKPFERLAEAYSAAESYYPDKDNEDYEYERDIFVSGAIWADQYPETDDIYEWYERDVEPTASRDILIETWADEYVLGVWAGDIDWGYYRIFARVKRWRYIERRDEKDMPKPKPIEI